MTKKKICSAFCFVFFSENDIFVRLACEQVVKATASSELITLEKACRHNVHIVLYH